MSHRAGYNRTYVPSCWLKAARQARQRGVNGFLGGLRWQPVPGVTCGAGPITGSDISPIACSTGSACTAGLAEPSHVLLAMGADDSRARGSLRFSLGHTSAQPDVDALGQVIRGAPGR
jgi:hypothetical protein